MFAGIGGFDLGLEATGYFKTIMQSEIEKYPQSILVEHWPDAIQVGDCTQANYTEYDVQVDVICGGFPCQDISIAGRQKGITGERSSLFSEMLRAANHYKQKYILFENVRRLLSINNGEDFLYVLSEINAAGYNAEWRIVSAESVGAPHKRERLFIVAYAKELGNAFGCGLEESVDASKSASSTGARSARDHQAGNDDKELGYTISKGLQERDITAECYQPTFWDTETDKELGNTEHHGHATTKITGSNEQTNKHSTPRTNQSSEYPRTSSRTYLRTIQPRLFTRNPRTSTYWDTAIQYRGRLVEPHIPLLADGVSNRAHQIKAYGNAIVPQVAEYVGQMVKQFDIKTMGKNNNDLD